MTTSPRPNKRAGRARRSGFTLVEVMICSTLGAFILAGILSVFLFIGRTGFAFSSYFDMEAQARKSMETFAMDVRSAKDVTWNDTANASNGNSVTLTIPSVASNGSDTLVTYYYDSATQAFYRKSGDAASTSAATTLVTGLTSFGFQRYRAGTLGTATNDLETKQLQLTLTAARTGVTVVNATQIVLSARYILRNKFYSQATASST